jgi:hypothetical protein
LIEHFGCCAWPNPRQQLQNSKSGNSISNVFAPAQHAQHVFDVGGFQEFQAAILYKWNVAAGEFDFKLGTSFASPGFCRI